MDELGRIHQSYYVSYDTGQIPYNRATYLYTTDRGGKQILPTRRILPWVGTGGTEYVARGWQPISCNATGETILGYSNANVFGFWTHSDGTPEIDPLWANFESALSTLHDETDATADVNNNGKFAITWAGTYDIVPNLVPVKLFWPAGDSISNTIWAHEVPLSPSPGLQQVNNILRYPVVKVADNGNFVVSWIAMSAGYVRILYVVFNADGTPASNIEMAECNGVDPFDPDACPTNYPNWIDIAMESDGDFYIFWFGGIHDHIPGYESSWHFWVRGFHADGTPKYDAKIVNDADTLYNLDLLVIPQIACNDNGEIVVGWSDSRLHPESSYNRLYYDVYIQRLDSEGNLVGHNMRVNNDAGNCGIFGTHFGVDLDNNGQTVIAWRNAVATYEIYGQLMPFSLIGNFVPGDLNCDLTADIADLTSLVAYMFLGLKNTYWPRSITDLNGDSNNGDIADITYLVDYFFGGGPVPHTPDPGPRPPINPPTTGKSNTLSAPIIARPPPEELVQGFHLR